MKSLYVLSSIVKWIGWLPRHSTVKLGKVFRWDLENNRAEEVKNKFSGVTLSRSNRSGNQIVTLLVTDYCSKDQLTQLKKQGVNMPTCEFDKLVRLFDRKYNLHLQTDRWRTHFSDGNCAKLAFEAELIEMDRKKFVYYVANHRFVVTANNPEVGIRHMESSQVISVMKVYIDMAKDWYAFVKHQESLAAKKR